jgi:hypothetical protein
VPTYAEAVATVAFGVIRADLITAFHTLPLAKKTIIGVNCVHMGYLLYLPSTVAYNDKDGHLLHFKGAMILIKLHHSFHSPYCSSVIKVTFTVR